MLRRDKLVCDAYPHLVATQPELDALLAVTQDLDLESTGYGWGHDRKEFLEAAGTRMLWQAKQQLDKERKAAGEATSSADEDPEQRHEPAVLKRLVEKGRAISLENIETRQQFGIPQTITDESFQARQARIYRECISFSFYGKAKKGYPICWSARMVIK